MENLKLLVLLNKEILITKIEEVPSELGEPDCKLIDPFIIKKNQINDLELILEPWLNEYAKQNTYMINSDKILTIADPNLSLKEKYIDIIK